MTGNLGDDLLARVRDRLADETGELTPARVAAALRAESGGVLGDSDLLAALRHLQTELTGAGPLEDLLADPAVTDVLVTAPDDPLAKRRWVAVSELASRHWMVREPGSGTRALSEEFLATHGLTPRARIHHLSVRGDDPVWMLTGPIRATRHALESTGLSIDDIDLFECNEAFASVVLAWMKETGAPHEKVNVNGGGIALGHPIGATGTRLMTTMLNELERTGGRYGLQTMCEGGGQANVTIIERL